MQTKRMRVANEAFLIDRLAADTPPLQQIRELTENAIEAINRRFALGDTTPGIIRWDVDWLQVPKGRYKLAIIDNGDGMTGDEMQQYLNSLAVQGANQAQGLTGNFGVGAKITALYHNRAGLIYQSWKNAVGSTVVLHRDDERGFYGLRLVKLPDGSMTYAAPISDKVKPSIISTSGTKVVLMGHSDDDNTCVKPEGAVGGATNWLYKYLNTRYFQIPEHIKIQVRSLRKDPAEWPKSEPPSSDKTFNFETIVGMKALLDENANDKGTVKLSNARVYWWLFDDPKAVDKKVNPRALGPGHVGLIFQDEIYTARAGNAGRKLMAGFGIIYGSNHVVLYVEPRESDITIHADTARSRVIIDGEDVDDGDWWSIWGTEFKEKMPAAIKEMMDRLVSAADDSNKSEKRQRILERLERIRALLVPSRFRRNPSGNLRAVGEVTGGEARARSESHSSPSKSGFRTRSGRSIADDYLAELVAEGGDAVIAVTTKRPPPEPQWVSLANGLRQEGELEDLAAEIPGDPVVGDVIKVNEDFRGFRDLVDLFVREFHAEGDDTIIHRIVEVMKEWVETQLLEVVVTVRNLEDGKVWTKDVIEKALSPEALTTAMMARYFIVERMRRVLGNELVRPKTKVPGEAAA